MKRVSEITERGSQELPKKSRLGWGLTLAKLLLQNPGALKKLRVMGPDEERYVRPPREYELPPFRESMQHCTSNEKYLRPTRWCNPREPEVIAIANELGAYELPDYEFADAAFCWVKTNVASEMVPMDRVSATLKRGTGTCFHLTSLWIALCRAAGIKARYKIFKAMSDDVAMNLDMVEILGPGETEQEMLPDLLIVAIGHVLPDLLNTGMPHPEGEVCIDGKWVVADVGMRPEIESHEGVPITKLGEDSIGLTWKLIRGTTERSESLPWMRGITMRAQSWLVPVVTERSNIVLTEMLALGRKIIEEAGGIEAYDLNARKGKELAPTEEITGALARFTEDAQRKQLLLFEE
jgi:hypothetical protein